jgi:hypothetical protein
MPVAVLGVAGLFLLPAATLWVVPGAPVAWGCLGALFLILGVNAFLLLQEGSLRRLALVARAARRGTALLEAALVGGLLGRYPEVAGLAGVLLVTATALPAMVADRYAEEAPA